MRQRELFHNDNCSTEDEDLHSNHANLKESSQQLNEQQKQRFMRERFEDYILISKNELAHLETKKKSMFEQIAACEQKMSMKYEQVKQLIKTQYDDLLWTLNNFKATRLEEISTRENQVREILEKIESLKTSATEMMTGEGSEFDVSYSSSSLVAKSMDISQSPVAALTSPKDRSEREMIFRASVLSDKIISGHTSLIGKLTIRGVDG